MSDYYIVSVKHTNRDHRYITFWRPDNNGYAWPLSWAGRYPEAAVRESLDYYNGGGNVAVPCRIIDPIAMTPVKGYIDNDAGPVVENNRANWNLILANLISPPKYTPRPEFKGARKQPAHQGEGRE